jgi:C4-type Zn-finger protein
MEDLAQFHGGVRALLGTFGFLNPAKIAWNMVPYSFVLGWFTNIEGLIDRYGNMQQLATDWRVDRMTHSVKTRCTIDIYQANRLGSRTLFRDRLGSAVVEVYKRETGLSVSDSILTLSAPSTKQSALLAALVAGRNY